MVPSGRGPQLGDQLRGRVLRSQPAGPVRLRNASHERDRQPIEADCPCPACEHSRGYIRHLFQAGEMLGPILASIHNLTYYQRLMTRAREAIAADAFAEFRRERMRGWNEAV